MESSMRSHTRWPHTPQGMRDDASVLIEQHAAYLRLTNWFLALM